MLGVICLLSVQIHGIEKHTFRLMTVQVHIRHEQTKRTSLKESFVCESDDTGHTVCYRFTEKDTLIIKE